ncbi:MAG: hypothetical protein IJ719_00800 [Clostridia bacterium]|nr:hypothetical protein [Clostridia bacterium]
MSKMIKSKFSFLWKGNAGAKDSEIRESGRESWLGFYTHTSLPILALQPDFKSEQC